MCMHPNDCCVLFEKKINAIENDNVMIQYWWLSKYSVSFKHSTHSNKKKTIYIHFLGISNHAQILFYIYFLPYVLSSSSYSSPPFFRRHFSFSRQIELIVEFYRFHCCYFFSLLNFIPDSGAYVAHPTIIDSWSAVTNVKNGKNIFHNLNVQNKTILEVV